MGAGELPGGVEAPQHDLAAVADQLTLSQQLALPSLLPQQRLRQQGTVAVILLSVSAEVHNMRITV